MSGRRQQHTPDRGDIIYANFTRHAGSEMAGSRPGIVLSEAAFSVATGMMSACPITNQVKRSPFEVVLPANLKTSGCVVASEVRSLDYLQRGIRFIEKAPVTVVQDVQAIVCAILGCN